MTGTLHGLSHAALELQRSAGDAAGQNLTLLVEELLQELGVLVVDVLDATAFETAVFLLAIVNRQRSQITDFALIVGSYLFLCHSFYLLIIKFYSLVSSLDSVTGASTALGASSTTGAASFSAAS